MPDSRSLIQHGFWHVLYRLCARFGHWYANVEEGVARCRICRTLHFCSCATHEQFERWMLK